MLILPLRILVRQQWTKGVDCKVSCLVNYDALLTHAQALQTPISQLVTSVGDITTNFADTFDSASGIASIKSSLGSNLDVNSILFAL